MDSKRRMIEIHIWDQPFFSELSQTEKLLYWLMTCKCDNVGVYRHNPKLAAFHCEGEIDIQAFIDKVNFDQQRLEIIESGSLWIKDFVRDTWSTIAAGNNLGLSCYKLLVKHGLLGRFITEYPNSINIASFRKAITEGDKGYSELPLPQSRPSPDPESTVYEEYEGQGRGRAGTINNTINRNKGISDSNGIPSLDVAQSILDAYPKKNRNGSDISILATIEDLLKDLKTDGVKDPESYLLGEIEKLSRKEAPLPEVFFEGLKQKKEVPF